MYYDTPPSFYTRVKPRQESTARLNARLKTQDSTTGVNGRKKSLRRPKIFFVYDTNILPKISVKIHLLRYVLVVNYPLLQIALTGVNLFIGTLRLTYIKSVDFFHTFSTEFPHFSRFLPRSHSCLIQKRIGNRLIHKASANTMAHQRVMARKLKSH